MNAAWSPPKSWPPSVRPRLDLGFARLGGGKYEPACPLPVLEVELDLLDRPSSTKALPLHPLGAERLFQHAKIAGNELFAGAGISDEHQKMLLQLVWEKCRECYCPGQPARITFERLAESAPEPNSATVDPSLEDLLNQRLEFLATTCAIQGLLDWVEPGERDVVA